MAQDARHATIKRVFGSLVSNAQAVDGAKYSPWWVGVIMFILGIILPIVPLFVSAASTDGTSFMSACEYGLGMDKTFGATINGLEGSLTFDNTDKTISYSGANGLIGSYVSTSGETNGQYELRVYYSDITDTETISNYVTDQEKVSYKKGTTQIASENDDAYIPSSIYFFKNTFTMDIYASNSVEKKAIMSNLADLNCFDYDGSDLKAYFVGSSFDVNKKEDRVNSFNKFKDLIDTTYETTRTKSMWLGSLIYVGIYVAFNLIMALMLFIMSRGKNNPNNYLNFWHCIKIDFWASLCPGILGLIFGFIFSGSAVMIYVMLIAMRSMWLSMRELRPQYQG
mgnify:CR=1 FL=1